MAEEQRELLYKVIFINQDQIYEIFAKGVTQGDLFGFVDIIEPVFGSHTELLIDPAEERLQDEFAGVERFHVPVQAVIRIDQVSQQGKAKIRSLDGKGGHNNISHFPIKPLGD